MLQMPILIKFQNLIPVMKISQIAKHHFNTYYVYFNEA